MTQTSTDTIPLENFHYANVEKGIILFKRDPKQTILSRKTGFVYICLRKAPQ